MGTPRLGRLLFVLLLVATNVLLFRAFVRWGETPTAVAGFLYPYELQAYDALLQTYGSQAAIHPRLRVIGVDDSSLEVFGPWPWNRAIHAQLVDRLREGGASVGAFDFIFESQAEGTEPFAASLASFKHGVLANTLPSATRPDHPRDLANSRETRPSG